MQRPFTTSSGSVHRHVPRPSPTDFVCRSGLLSLDKELRNFSNAARQLGSSVGILSSSFHLRERLTFIGYLFRENAADLFPRKIPQLEGQLRAAPKIVQQKSAPGRVSWSATVVVDLVCAPRLKTVRS